MIHFNQIYKLPETYRDTHFFIWGPSGQIKLVIKPYLYLLTLMKHKLSVTIATLAALAYLHMFINHSDTISIPWYNQKQDYFKYA